MAELEQEQSLLRDVSRSETFPYPRTPEAFTEEEQAVLSQFFTNTDKPVFVLKNLPQEVSGAMFSRYSRTDKSLRRLFLDEFWAAPELGMQTVVEYLQRQDPMLTLESAQARTKSFYRRIFAEYGDDSVIQMGSVHIAFEGVSQLAAKAIEDGRIGAAYIEKSTRYVNFSEQQNGHYLFSEPNEIGESPLHDEFIEWNNACFDAYSGHLKTATEFLSGKYPLESQTFQNPQTGVVAAFSELTDPAERAVAQTAYRRALRAKAFDTIRVFLPTTTVTNLGAHWSGQAAEHAINKMLVSDLDEVRQLGAMAYEELSQVAGNFLQNVDHPHGVVTRQFDAMTKARQEVVASLVVDQIPEVPRNHTVRLVAWDQDADVRIASQTIFTGQGKNGRSSREIIQWAQDTKAKEAAFVAEFGYSPTLGQIIQESVPDRSQKGYNRRHKLPRAFERGECEVEFFVDFGIYRDLQRNRISSTERQRLNAQEVSVPREFHEPGMESVLSDYLRLATWTKDLNQRASVSEDTDVQGASEYITLLGNKMRFNVHANLRQWTFFTELRTIEGGHPAYRHAMQNAARQIRTVYPFMKPLMAHVNGVKDYGLGRLKAEVRTQQKLGTISE